MSTFEMSNKKLNIYAKAQKYEESFRIWLPEKVLFGRKSRCSQAVLTPERLRLPSDKTLSHDSYSL